LSSTPKTARYYRRRPRWVEQRPSSANGRGEHPSLPICLGMCCFTACVVACV
jgi:hypothetical protein